MVKTLEQLKRELAREKIKLETIEAQKQLQNQRRRVKFELARIRHPGFFRAGETILKGSKSIGRGIITQAKLIKQQQVREQKERIALSKAIKKSSVIKKIVKRVPIKRKRVKKRKKKR